MLFMDCGGGEGKRTIIFLNKLLLSSKMSYYQFNDTEAGRINKKEKKYDWLFIALLFIYVGGLLVVSLSFKKFIDSIVAGNNILIWTIVLISSSIAFIFALAYVIESLKENKLSRKERTLIVLFNTLNNFDNFVKNKETRIFKKIEKDLILLRNILDETRIRGFGTKWERETTSYLQGLGLFLDTEIIQKFEIDTSNQTLNNIRANLHQIFTSLYEDDYSKLKEEYKLDELNKKFNEKLNISFWEKYKLDKNKIITIGKGLGIILFLFAIYTFVSKLYFTFSLKDGLAIAFGLPTTLYA